MEISLKTNLQKMAVKSILRSKAMQIQKRYKSILDNKKQPKKLLLNKETWPQLKPTLKSNHLSQLKLKISTSRLSIRPKSTQRKRSLSLNKKLLKNKLNLILRLWSTQLQLELEGINLTLKFKWPFPMPQRMMTKISLKRSSKWPMMLMRTRLSALLLSTFKQMKRKTQL